ncbi:YveK family protein [Effusibacillus consociatus]|uniref:YveK family protein n=1 Tax=Effusibacillus consociatus TaxID=1117041 RepID=A0ABV9Q6F6_9BACL
MAESTQEIELREMFEILQKRWKMIFSLTLIATLASTLITFFLITPKYQASTELLVNKTERDSSAVYNFNDIQTDLKLTETYNVIIKSPRILEQVIQQQQLETTSSELTRQVKVSTVKNSQVISITVTDSDYEQAAMIANAIASTFKKEIVKIMRVDNVQILAEAQQDIVADPVSPKTILNISLGLIIGLMVSVSLALLLEYLDTTLRTEEQIEVVLGLPVVGSIAPITKEHLRSNTPGGFEGRLRRGSESYDA